MRAVHDLGLHELHDAGSIATRQFDELMAAFDLAVEYAGLAVARAWLRERGSLPIPAE